MPAIKQTWLLHCMRCEIGLHLGETCVFCESELEGKRQPLDHEAAFALSLFRYGTLAEAAGEDRDEDFHQDMYLLDTIMAKNGIVAPRRKKQAA